MDITSRANPLIIEAAKLNNKKFRDLTHTFAFEGVKLFREAIKRNAPVKRVFVTVDAYSRIAGSLVGAEFEVLTVSDGVYGKLTDDRSPDGVFCVCGELDGVSRKTELPRGSSMILCDIQDAGNLGTCIRSALAFGMDSLILCGECADVYNKKCVRSSMGALFSQRIVRFDDPLEAVSVCKAAGKKVYAAALKDYSLPLDRLGQDPDVVFAVGNEGHGLSDAFIAACDGAVVIPMSGDTESLNAAIASSVLMWETAKNRRCSADVINNL